MWIYLLEKGLIKLPEDEPMEVVMHYGAWSLKPNEDGYHFSVAIVKFLKGEIIGNKVENPELLNKGK